MDAAVLGSSCFRFATLVQGQLESMGLLIHSEFMVEVKFVVT
jgi:hypothetical protein